MLKKLAGFVGCFLLIGSLTLLARTGVETEAVPEFKLVPDWVRLPEGFQFGPTVALATDKDDNLFVFHRGKHPIAVFDKNGKFLRSWGDEQVKTAHGLRLDHDGNVWTTDIGNHLVIKYDPAGKVLLTLGKKNKAGATPDLFNKPADVAVSPAGDIYVADGYGNSRVVKFSKDGKYVREWGKKGKEPGEFNLPHAIFLDAKGRVYVGDRENSRVQVFDADGKFLEQWPDTGAPYGLTLDRGRRVFIADGNASLVRVFDLEGKLLGRWGQQGADAEKIKDPHGICADSGGAIYVTTGMGTRLQKFLPQ